LTLWHTKLSAKLQMKIVYGKVEKREHVRSCLHATKKKHTSLKMNKPHFNTESNYEHSYLLQI